ncbi:hypothetical protein VNO78_16365 [Psophocarpus tetragonolobus]|uniref:Uncharacterized protein n=1 Tax=Psophocarpus tetragonolobus TaxID=3891 RepID=A0AAN9SGK4_PSOTE
MMAALRVKWHNMNEGSKNGGGGGGKKQERDKAYVYERSKREQGRRRRSIAEEASWRLQEKSFECQTKCMIIIIPSLYVALSASPVGHSLFFLYVEMLSYFGQITLLENVRMLEVKLCLSNQKLQVTQQLLSEKKESSRKTKEKFQQHQITLEDRIITLLACEEATEQ